MILIHYAEIGLKGKNRNLFEAQLIRNIKTALEGVPYRFVRKISGRVIVACAPSVSLGEEEQYTHARLSRVFGISSMVYVARISRDLTAMASAACALLKNRSCASFAISTKRSDKQYPLSSMEVNSRVGQYVKDELRVPVELEDPQCTCTIEIVHDAAFIGTNARCGPGGMPVGSSGAVCALLSGGIDSPVAAWRMMKRGARVHCVHFHNYPFADRASIEKVKELVSILKTWHGVESLALVPFTDIQKTIMLHTTPRYRMILYRRFMVRIAEALARKIRTHALVTGDSLGQVASQTLENIATIDAVATMPIMRPLIGLDKQEIIAEARTIGTYEVSILPHTDCCTMFIPKHPATKARLDDIQREETKLPVTELVQEAVARTETEEI